MTSRRNPRRGERDVRNADAHPAIHALDQFGTPWRMKLVYALEEGEQRFNELKRSTGARSKTLSDALGELVEHEIVSRRTEDGNPIAVYYGLTPKGTDLLDALDGIEAWSRNWGSDFAEPNPQRHSRS